MGYWTGGYVQDLLIIVALIAVAAGLRRGIAPLRRLGMPDALIAGGIGMLCGPAVLGLLPFSPERLEFLIYHGLALVFIAVSLQAPPPGNRTGTALSISFAVPAVAVLQAVIGLSCVLVWNLVAGGPNLHPGFGMMLPLGFNQGPGPAMTLGSTWDAQAGLHDGAQIGLIMASMGYLWCCVIGIVFVAWGRRRGWDRTKGRAELGTEQDLVAVAPRPEARRATAGGLEPLTAQLVAIAIAYLGTWVFLELISPVIPSKQLATVWGFHFLIATGFALLLRPIAARIPGGNPLDNDLLARISSVIVDITTCAALAAVSMSTLGTYLAPILLISTIGGLMTLFACVWMARRVFPTAPFQHAVVTYGSLTGTATTGMALLRMLDPDLSGPAVRNYVRAVPLAAVLGAPLLLTMPIAVLEFPDSYPAKPYLMLAILFAYVAVLIVAWRVLAPLRFGASWWRLWPDDDGEG